MYADAHCDTLTKAFDARESLYENPFCLDFKRLKENNCCLQFMAIWTDPVYEQKAAFERCMDVIDYYYSQAGEDINTVLCSDGMSYNKLNILLSVEGGGLIDNKIENLHKLYDKGVRAMTLTWNEDNCISGGIENNSTGLTDFGKEVVREMNRLGMIVDLSHISEKGFWDVADICDNFIVSHSNCRSLCNHKRNLTDDQIKCVIERGGFIGLNFYPLFLNENRTTVNDILRHADYILNLGGEKVLGFGSDFDGTDSLPDGVRGVEDMVKITSEFFKNDILFRNLYRNIEKIMKK